MAALKDLAAGLLCTLGVPAVARWRRSRRLAILMFHGVESEPLTPPCDWVIDTATLRRDLDYVRRHFNVLPLEEALERLDDGTLPPRAATVTFDDGTQNLLTNAAPVLRELGVPAAVFLATGPMGTTELLWPDRLWTAFAQTDRAQVDLSAVGLGTRSLRTEAERIEVRDTVTQLFKQLPDQDRIAELDSLIEALGQRSGVYGGPFQLLSWDLARELAADGLVTLYPHTVTHPILARCDDDKVDREITASCRAVEHNTGRAPAVFAYPNGCAQDFDDRAKAALHRNGIRWALTTTNGFAEAGGDPLELPRMGFSTDQSFPVFKLKVSGFALRPGRVHAVPSPQPGSSKVAGDVAV
ncbi:polysaccharide deacetylase family protein [Mycobacterium sp. NAZ190054]|uniref:polysaccharide deacetylase family protein n=1 Tax=Mycobacterium sp. NAZ190054 TaxID=1747766 RepID=UPI0007961BD3|nr:polysaccharide deacetylase family protein [Mycobacterium sp. NAZ190054]KWX66510.1 polysaccharide deacetylase [Mycobacterium sp. NAZ190054]